MCCLETKHNSHSRGHTNAYCYCQIKIFYAFHDLCNLGNYRGMSNCVITPTSGYIYLDNILSIHKHSGLLENVCVCVGVCVHVRVCVHF